MQRPRNCQLGRLVEEAGSAATQNDTEMEDAPWLPPGHYKAVVMNAADVASDIIKTPDMPLSSSTGQWPWPAHWYSNYQQAGQW